jgi:hypothetical protein
VIVLDSSVLVGIIKGERDAERLLDLLAKFSPRPPVTSTGNTGDAVINTARDRAGRWSSTERRPDYVGHSHPSVLGQHPRNGAKSVELVRRFGIDFGA